MTFVERVSELQSFICLHYRVKSLLKLNEAGSLISSGFSYYYYSNVIITFLQSAFCLPTYK